MLLVRLPSLAGNRGGETSIGSPSLLAEERGFPEETAARMLVSGRMIGGDYRAPGLCELGSMSSVRHGGTDTLTVLLDEPVAHPRRVGRLALVNGEDTTRIRAAREAVFSHRRSS